MGGDARAHDPGADDRDLLNLGLNVGHHIASSTVAMPWPPPMHWVASAYLPFSRFKQRGRLAEDARAGRAERMAERNRAAVDIDLIQRELQIADAGDRLRSEGFVELDDVELADLDAGALQRLARGADRTDAHDLRAAAADGDGFDRGQNVEVMALRVILRADQERGGAVGQRRGGSRGDDAMSR